MQFTNKTTFAFAGIAGGLLLVGVVVAQPLLSSNALPVSRPSQAQQTSVEPVAPPLSIIGPKRGVMTSDTTKTPIDRKWAEAFEAKSRQAMAVEKEARQLLKERRFAEAEKACHRALALSPTINGQPANMVVLQLLGDVRLEQKQYQKALDTYFRARQHSRNLELDLNIALCYLKLGDMDKAHSFYDEKKLFDKRLGNNMLPGEKETYMASLPGTATAKTMEASIYFARGREKSSFAQVNEAVEDYKKALVLVPRNALIAYSCAQDLARFYRGQEAIPYWARAAVFGQGYIAKDGKRQLKDVVMPAQAEQALSDARKITG